MSNYFWCTIKLLIFRYSKSWEGDNYIKSNQEKKLVKKLLSRMKQRRLRVIEKSPILLKQYTI